MTVECDAVPLAMTLTATDNCGSAEVSYKETRTDGNCPSNYTLVRVWTAEDECGNTTVHKQTITVQDTNAPAFVEDLPMDMTVECDAVPMAMTLTATDNCGSASVEYGEIRNDGNCPSSYTLVRTWTAMDECGNTTVHTHTITVQDTTAPAFVEDLPMDMTVECDAVPMEMTLTATDNCGSAEVSYKETRTDGNCPSNYTLVRVWTAEDECGNTTVHKQTITVQDTTAPAFVEDLPMDMTVECDAVPMTMTLTATDNCGVAEVSYKETRTDGNCPSNYTLVRVWTAEDECGNTTVHKQTITVQDTNAPAFVEDLPMDMTVECDAVPMAMTLTATDNCGSASVEYGEIRNDGNCPSSYTLVRTWTAMDECGNTTVHTQTITVQDTTAPAFVEELPMDMTVECDAVPMAMTLTATDNCGAAEVSYKETRTDGNCPSNYTLVRIWTAEDECGNTTVHKQTITVQDTTAPAFVEVLPMDMTVECDAVPMAMTLTATDNCGVAEVSYKETRTDGNCPSNYTLVRVWTAEDECGNTTVHKQTITVQDTTAPAFVEDLPMDMTVECDAVPMAMTLTATDNCGSAEVSYKETRTDGNCPSNYTLVRVWTAEDECGNTTVHKQTITVQDTTAPAFVEDLPMDMTVECDAVPMAMTLTATDNCGSAEVSYKETRTDGNCPSNYTLVRVWTAEDECGNTTVHKQTITVQDTTAPAFVEDLPMDMTVECDAVPMAMTLTATDNCGSAEVSYKETRTDGNCPSNYTLVRVWTAEDECGNTTVHTQTITVQDTTAPAFVEDLPMDMTVECDAVPMAMTLTATDNCGSASVEYGEIRNDGNCPSNYTLVRTWTAMDECGNTTVHTQTITVQDTSAPAFVEELPMDMTVECDAVPMAMTLTATDNCGSAEVSYKETRTDGNCPSNYTLVRVWTAEDECGNTTVHTQTITVQDTTAPAFVEDLPMDMTVECDAVPMAMTLTATDNCGSASVEYGEVRNDGNCPSNYTLVRTWTAMDECGNTTVHSQTITVQDTTAPAFVEDLPMDMTVECDAVPMAMTLTATDNCGSAEVSYKETRTDGNCPSNYTLVRVWTAEDECGNTTVHKQTITVQDTTAPAFVEDLPMDMTVECDAVPMAMTLTATDNCGSAEVSYKETRTDGNCPSNYTLVRVWTAEDECGNTTVHKQTITVQDTTAPAFVEDLPMDMTVECDAVPMAMTLTATDNCGSAEVSYKETRTDGNCPSNYTLVRTWTAMDECGNTTVHTQTITVQDTSAPAFVEELPMDMTVECDAVPMAMTLTATDNCGSASVEYGEIRNDGNCPSNYTLVRTWTAMDECGNTTVHTQTITVQDTTAPAFVEELPMDMTVECDAVPMAMTLTATDNCGSASVEYGEIRNDGNCPSNYTLVRTWTAMDECGNTTVHTQTITVQDTSAPAFVEELPMDMTVECDAVPMAMTLTATDNCGSAEVSYKETRTDGNCPSNYTLVRVWTAEDECGNTTVHTQTITVQDTTAPMTVAFGSASVEYGEDLPNWI
ncbi:hypothetical protein H9X57_16590 [Flavobacterium piscinae]|uniref:HYR-like domain-containing protein n=1 Tax=Flavobacterium piscinae TaxID=2506424 RepID=UPI0019B0EBBB|nr:hypothetical protein [Flavobacterium piscinae]MBC8884404.1 hypothetical protein [Flavobacterium piscinae]